MLTGILSWLNDANGKAACRSTVSGERPNSSNFRGSVLETRNVVTSNAHDFIRLLNVEVHPGLIIFRESGLTRDEQWDRIRPVIDQVLESGDDNCLVNKLIEISGAGEWETREIPKP